MLLNWKALDNKITNMVSLNLLLTYVDNIMLSAIFWQVLKYRYFFFIQVIGDRLQASLETQLLDAVSQDNRDALRRCLRIYATVDKVEINSTILFSKQVSDSQLSFVTTWQRCLCLGFVSAWQSFMLMLLSHSSCLAFLVII